MKTRNILLIVAAVAFSAGLFGLPQFDAEEMKVVQGLAYAEAEKSEAQPEAKHDAEPDPHMILKDTCTPCHGIDRVGKAMREMSDEEFEQLLEKMSKKKDSPVTPEAKEEIKSLRKESGKTK